MPNRAETIERILHLARELAMVHIGDGDILGTIARELREEIDDTFPKIKDLPNDTDP